MGEPKKDELDKDVIKNDTLRKYFPESSTPREMEEKIIGLLEESKTEKVVFRSDSIKKYFPSNYFVRTNRKFNSQDARPAHEKAQA